ncbi:dTDP-4-dehydrorhamnose reductase [Thermithiobacillus plumbiphilus]|uniref:dTDP-4-dehydrorhamnose reductase n=1 Tax=Thermithiobacillus plumbiphilus TaxID=1729899 RepID=A0ABU9D8G6_9PROT
MKVLITGASGQLGQALQDSAPGSCELLALDSRTLDISQADAVRPAVSRFAPSLIINAAAYTKVDQAETEPGRAHAVNAEGAANLARAAQGSGARLIHISTDFVFDGNKSTPYQPADQTNPLGVYGASKCEGEQQVQEITQSQALIIRTAWVYAAHGNNFVKTMLRLMAEREQLAVVSDQIGTPTSAHTLAQAIWRAASKPDLRGIYHWTDSGVASWYDFALAIQEEALALGLLDKAIPIRPIRTQDYPTPAKRPAYSVLDKTQSWADFDLAPLHWRVALRQVLQELKEQRDA